MTAWGTLPRYGRMPRGTGVGGSNAGRPLLPRELKRWEWLESSPHLQALRDLPHKAAMNAGQCLACYGWVDDPRHTEIRNATLRPE
jgi:hypothetical protein